MKTIALLIAFASLVFGCSVPAPAGFDVTEAVSVAHYEGSFAETYQGCKAGETLQGGDCLSDVGAVVSSKKVDAKWYCRVKLPAGGASVKVTTYCATDNVVSHQ